jgi:hypothetical protein
MAFDYRDVLLSRLAFVARFESVVRYLQIRAGRSAPREERLTSGSALLLTYQGRGRYRLDPAQSDLPIDAGGFPNWLLHEDTLAGHRAAVGYDDFVNRARVWIPKNLPLALAGILKMEIEQDGSITLDLEVKNGPSTPTLQKDSTYLLCPRFTDFNTDQVIAELDALNGEQDPFFLRLIRTPHLANESINTSPSIRSRVLALATSHGMTRSQQEAFAGILDSRLRLVWGSPGTGNTHFLALALLFLAEAQRGAGRPFRVLLIGFTHVSIDN